MTAAEESTAWPGVSRPTYDGGLGFTYKWNMGWMNDTLGYMHKEPIHRSHHQNELTFSLIYAFTENFMLPLSHDEVVHGKGSLISQMPGDMWQKFANLRLLYSYMWTHPGKKLLFMGGELAQWNEWNHDDGPHWELLDFDTHRGVQQLVVGPEQVGDRESRPAPIRFLGRGIRVGRLHERGTTARWFIFARAWTVRRRSWSAAISRRWSATTIASAFHKRVLERDFQQRQRSYGGTNVGNYPGRKTLGEGHHGRPDSISVDLPPLATTIFRLEQ